MANVSCIGVLRNELLEYWKGAPQTADKIGKVISKNVFAFSFSLGAVPGGLLLKLAARIGFQRAAFVSMVFHSFPLFFAWFFMGVHLLSDVPMVSCSTFQKLISNQNSKEHKI